MNKNVLVNITTVVGLAIIAGLLFTGSNDFAENQPVKVTGEDIATNPDQYRSYVDGVIDGALVADSDVSYMCQNTKTDNEIVSEVVRTIHDDTSLQNQSGSFAVLNAYGRLYCGK